MNFSIEVKALSVFAGSTRLMGPVSFHIRPGGTLVVMGETGAGKSLIAQAILGTLPSALRADGEIIVDGRRVDQLPIAERAKLWGREIATLPQEPWRALNPLMRSFRQVKETHLFVAGRNPQEAASETGQAFETLSLKGAENRLPGALSGGMAQRVAFAAATAANAPILLADEPTKGLDAERHRKVVDLLAEVPQNGGTLLAITHEVSVARRLGGEILVLRDGDLVEQGMTKSVLNAPSDRYTQSLLDADPQNWPENAPREVGETVLRVQDLAVARGNKRLFEGFNLDLRTGEKVALTGPSGIGKTTLLDAIGGLLKPESGHVSRQGALSKNSIQKLYQDPPAAFPNRVRLIHTLQDVARLNNTGWPDVLQTLEHLGIHPSLLERRPDEVSGGELQRISIARALTVKPKIILADEPTSRLDPITQRETLAMLDRIASDEQIAIILVTHDQNISTKWADRVISLV
ncbi:MAG: ABC transporter ATP-binding protein [Pelagimonas sp.]|uniref:ABC transporter ATP-binding protein n=1 Tax=Pelagimonas sp. TaxID=2073170 RepID=UPI003D6C41BB